MLPLDACFWARLVELAFSCQCSARGRACGAASDALREQSSPQPCLQCLVPSRVRHSSAIASGLKPQGRNSRRRRGGALVLVVGRSLRPALRDAVAARLFL